VNKIHFIVPKICVGLKVFTMTKSLETYPENSTIHTHTHTHTQNPHP